MDEQRKYEVIKKLVDEDGNKDRAAMTPGITKRHVNRLIKKYKENGKEAFSIWISPLASMMLEQKASIMDWFFV